MFIPDKLPPASLKRNLYRARNACLTSLSRRCSAATAAARAARGHRPHAKNCDGCSALKHGYCRIDISERRGRDSSSSRGGAPAHRRNARDERGCATNQRRSTRIIRAGIFFNCPVALA